MYISLSASWPPLFNTTNNGIIVQLTRIHIPQPTKLTWTVVAGGKWVHRYLTPQKIEMKTLFYSGRCINAIKIELLAFFNPYPMNLNPMVSYIIYFFKAISTINIDIILTCRKLSNLWNGIREETRIWIPWRNREKRLRLVTLFFINCCVCNNFKFYIKRVIVVLFNKGWRHHPQHLSFHLSRWIQKTGMN